MKTVPVGLLTVSTLYAVGRHLCGGLQLLAPDAAVLHDFMLEQRIVPMKFPPPPQTMYPKHDSQARRWEMHLQMQKARPHTECWSGLQLACWLFLNIICQ